VSVVCFGLIDILLIVLINSYVKKKNGGKRIKADPPHGSIRGAKTAHASVPLRKQEHRLIHKHNSQRGRSSFVRVTLPSSGKAGATKTGETPFLCEGKPAPRKPKNKATADPSPPFANNATGFGMTVVETNSLSEFTPATMIGGLMARGRGCLPILSCAGARRLTVRGLC
jgi:hypothetical protein